MSAARRARRAVRGIAGRLTATGMFAGSVAVAERLRRPRAGTLAVLTYHRIAEAAERPDLDPALVSATPTGFAEQMRMVARSGRAVTLEQVLDAAATGSPLPAGAVLVSFDDAYVDFLEHAWPVLEREGVPAVLFVATGYPDRPERAFWWDRLHRVLVAAGAEPSLVTPFGTFAVGSAATRALASATLRERLTALPHDQALAVISELEARNPVETAPASVLGWDALRRLANAGLSIGAHTDTHPLLDRISLAQVAAELATCRERLTQELGVAPRALAFPGGATSPAVVEHARAAGYELAFTTRRGVNDLGRANLHQLDRINVGLRASAALVRAQLLGRPARAAA